MNPLDDFVDRILNANVNESPNLVGKVKTVTAGAAKDGNAAVVVTVLGRDLPATYLSSYTPTVGHIVLLARTQPLAILGRLIGTPN